MFARYLPILQWLPNYRRADLREDVAAGFTTAVMLIPQAMGYAMLAGLPPIVGLYAALAPVVAYAVLGTSRQVSVGPVAMDSLLVAVSVGAIAEAGSDNYVAIAGLLGLMVGGVQLTLGLLRLGFVVNFLSRPVISGFTSAAALIIAASQLKYLLRIDLPATHHVPRVLFLAAQQIDAMHPTTIVLGTVSIVMLVLLKRYVPKFPRALVVVAAATAVCGLWLADAGVQVVGSVPSGLPSLRVPELSLEVMQTLVPAAFTISLVSFMEAISIGKHFARVNRYEVDPSQELVALGVANLAGALTGGYPIAGGVSRTAVAAAAGARTQLFSLVTVIGIAITLLWLTPLFYYMPKAALAAIIMTAVIGLVDLAEPRKLWRVKRDDFFLLTFTFVMTLSVGIQWGIMLGVLASLLLFIVRTTMPHVAVLGQVPGTEAYLNVDRHPHARPVPGVLVLRVDAQFYFGNVTFLKDTLTALERKMTEPLRAVVIDASGINQLDSSAEAALREIDLEYSERGVRLIFARVKGPVRDVMYRSGFLQHLDGEGRIVFRTHDAVQRAAGRPVAVSEPSPEEVAGGAEDPRNPADRVGCGKMSA